MDFKLFAFFLDEIKVEGYENENAAWADKRQEQSLAVQLNSCLRAFY